MRYRVNKRTGDKVSEIGFGSAYIYEAGTKAAVEAIRRAYDGGINYFDMAAGDGSAFPMYGEALSDVRNNIFYQIHFGADYSRGTYGWSLDLDTVKRSLDKQLHDLRTDYIDYGFIHCQDEDSDWETYQRNGVYDYLLKMKEEGVVKHTGLSSHTPSVIQRIMNEAEIDMLMFSVNPEYDYGRGDYAHGGVDERSEIYKRCEKEGVGISVMKPFSGGQLLDAKRSPFGQALTPFQCIKYALDKPGVLTVLPGAQSVAEVDELLSYYDKTDEELDYSVIGSFAPPQANGKCVYCNHCKPCPMGIDIGLVNKYYDLAKVGDTLAKEHYSTLEKKASDCISCGHCDDRCPFGVKQSERMTEIKSFME
ncbi:aldo/keto reductase [Butyrivibrio sp. AC2005]|uniref:aldo/keto reductase n=1 Tax=Butyrivibrio sp. AC2005 TaxID=1280672 RepID=UPI0004159EAB|nr:aldo/keto reductase [Butyrivibrio sp. AC2005]